AAIVYRRVEFLHRYRAEAIDVLELRQGVLLPGLQGEDVGRGADRQRRVFVVEEQLDLLLAQPFYVEGVARDEMADALDRLRGADKAAVAAAHRLALLAHRMAAAGGANVRKHIRDGIGRALLGHDVENLRDDVAGALHQHRVADADVPALADRLAVIADPAD